MSDGPAIFSPTGRIDGTNASGVERELLALLESSGPNLVFDLSRIDYMSSAGLRVVLVAAKRARASGGHAVLCGAKPQVQEVLRMSGFERIMAIVADIESARTRFG